MVHYLSEVLISIVRSHRIRSYMEIGVNEGRSLMAVVNNTKLDYLYVCDNWTGKHGGKVWKSHEHIATLLDNCQVPYTEYLDGDSQKTIPEWCVANPGVKVDLVLVDGNHDPEPAFQDLQNVAEFAKIIAFDDVMHPGHNLLDVWNHFVDITPSAEHQLHAEGHGVGVAVLEQLGA